MRKYYTYAYLRDDGTPYYIGKGSGKRAYQNQNRRGCSAPTDKSKVLFLKRNLTEEEAYRHEVYMIYHYGRKCDGGILHNVLHGGDGGSSGRIPPWTGKKRGKYNRKVKHHSEEHKDKLREATSKIPRDSKGRFIKKEHQHHYQ